LRTQVLESADIVVVGGGIVGVASAGRALAEFPSRRVVLIEKESTLAFHQTGRNSGVIHSGIYYKPGSLKALLCRQGRNALIEFCKKQGLDFDVCGKVIVATSEDEMPRNLEVKSICKHVRNGSLPGTTKFM
jgi:L-2-hydroxyglutarate oxidase